MKTTRIALITVIAAATAYTASARPGGPGPRGGGGLPFGLEPEDIVGAIFAKHDTNQDSVIDGTEIADAAEAKMAARQARAEERGRGLNRPDDFAPPTPEEIAARILENHDADENGSLSEEEVLDIVTQQNRNNRRKGGKGARGPRNGRGPNAPVEDDAGE